MTPRGRLWRERVREWRRSGLTQAAFCQQQDLNPGTFCWWKRQLARRQPRHSAPAASAAGVRATADPLQTTFAPLRIQADADHDHSPIEIVLPGARRIRLRGPIDRRQLADVLAVLEAAPC